jgi:hypothetical protein
MLDVENVVVIIMFYYTQETRSTCGCGSPGLGHTSVIYNQSHFRQVTTFWVETM